MTLVAVNLASLIGSMEARRGCKISLSYQRVGEEEELTAVVEFADKVIDVDLADRESVAEATAALEE